MSHTKRHTDSRIRTPGRFWRSVGRISLRQPDLIERTLQLIMLGLCAVFLIGMSGCASNGTILRVGLHIDATDLVNNCDRKLDAGCGLKGPREIAVLELMYAPGLKLQSTVVPYSSWLHNSHYSAGWPVNKDFEQVLDAPGFGGFIQFGDRR